jgi:pyruvate/2-oxoglutarate/acetoin dehydrogenase E1 component/TPP-dependent pyruvate/acetoin dehydrogenase alpha subunit
MQELMTDSIVSIGEWVLQKEGYAQEVIRDYWLCCVSREASLLSRKEVLTGKAKFGISGDGKEVAQIALSRFFLKGDYRSGYYRDQTMAFALGICSVEGYFAQLYADCENDGMSSGRQMSSHFASPFVDENGQWLDLKNRYNFSADISPTAGQMARALGLAFASKKYRQLWDSVAWSKMSDHGDEVVFCTIGDASTSEGVFFETINAAAVLQVPLVVSVWDDGYGISVPRALQTAKDSISRALEGFLKDDKNDNGILIYTVKAWDYVGLCEAYEKAVKKARETHTPVLVHVQEVTQPQGHSTSGSHERYKSKERLQWEQDMDGLLKMGEWMVNHELVTQEELDTIAEHGRQYARQAKNQAWNDYRSQAQRVFKELDDLFVSMENGSSSGLVAQYRSMLNELMTPMISEMISLARKLMFEMTSNSISGIQPLKHWLDKQYAKYEAAYNDQLYAEGNGSALNVPVVAAQYEEDAPVWNGFQILNQFFDESFEKRPELLAFGEDVGKIGDVNQGFAGLQEKFGEHRIFDTGIREWTIVGQAIGLAMRGFRPIAEIQYLDYLIYALSPLSDDLATLRYRTRGRQKAPVIIRTRGHRLEGIWHSGSPIGMLLGSLRGMHVLVPRNMTQAAGMYNTLLKSDEPALVVECLNGYRLKERKPSNLLDFTVPLGVPDVLSEGHDITLVTYGSSVRVAQEGIEQLSKLGISVELIDVQSLLPFDIHHSIQKSLRKTNRLMVLDEDVPGGASAFIMQQILEVQQGYRWLDAAPVTLTAHAHRPPYGSDGDYFSKPNPEDVVQRVWQIMHESDPGRFPLFS